MEILGNISGLDKVLGFNSSSKSLLDMFGDNVEFAFNSKPLRSGQNKYLRIRRDSDDSETDITLGSVESKIQDFGGSGSCFVTTIYDHSESGNDFTQTVTGSQPRIMDSGVVEKDSNGNVALWFDGVDDFLKRTPALQTGTGGRSIFFRSQTETEALLDEKWIFSLSRDIALAATSGQLMDFTSELGVRVLGFILFSEGVDAVSTLISMHLPDSSNVTDFTCYKNGSSVSVDSTDPATIDTVAVENESSIGANRTNTKFFKGHISSLLYFSADKSSSRESIEAYL